MCSRPDDPTMHDAPGDRCRSCAHYRAVHTLPDALCAHCSACSGWQEPIGPHSFRSPVTARNGRCEVCGEYEEDGPHLAAPRSLCFICAALDGAQRERGHDGPHGAIG